MRRSMGTYLPPQDVSRRAENAIRMGRAMTWTCRRRCASGAMRSGCVPLQRRWRWNRKRGSERRMRSASSEEGTVERVHLGNVMEDASGDGAEQSRAS